MYSILDIETTGSHAYRDGITEIAVINFDGEKITDEFSTLIRPDALIPKYIAHFTGITDNMVQSAPEFGEIAEQLESLTRNRILVAHNAHFDYSFLKQTFQRYGISFNRKILCTLRLSKKLLPGQSGYSLQQLCRNLNLQELPVHRAGSDAHAALNLFLHLKNTDHNGTIEAMLKKRGREFQLPPHLPADAINRLPEKPGVYYFLNKHDKVLYVGKAKNLRNRVRNHFTSGSSTRGRTKLVSALHKINFQLSGNELIALLMESAEIKKYFPPFNFAQKISNSNFGLYVYEDGKSFLRFGIKKLKRGDQPQASFGSLLEAKGFVREMKTEFQLCAKLCGLQQAPNACFDHDSGICDGACAGRVSSEEHNDRMKNAINGLRSDARSFALIGEGREPSERSAVVMQNGKYLGFGFAPKEKTLVAFPELKQLIEPQRDNTEVQWIIRQYTQRNNDYRVVLA